MTLEEAIKINTINNEHNPEYTDEQRRQAHQLGIEALKRLEDLRSRGHPRAFALLPGETEERTIQRHGKDIRGDYFYEEAKP